MHAGVNPEVPGITKTPVEFHGQGFFFLGMYLNSAVRRWASIAFLMLAGVGAVCGEK